MLVPKGEHGTTVVDFFSRLTGQSEVYSRPTLFEVDVAPSAAGEKSIRRNTETGTLSSLYKTVFRRFNVLLLKIVSLLENSKRQRVPAYRLPDVQSNLVSHFNSKPIRGELIKGCLELPQPNHSHGAQLFEDIDLLVDVTGYRLGETIESLPRFGVITCRYGDGYQDEGSVVGFFEVYCDLPATQFTVLWKNKGNCYPKTLYQGRIATEEFWGFNLARIQRKSAAFLFLALNKVINHETDEVLQPSPILLASARCMPDPSVLIHYFLKTHFKSALKKCVSFFTGRQKYNWSVSYLSPVGPMMALSQAKVVSNPRGQFYADPFLFEHSGEMFCFVEDYFRDENKGKISVLKLEEEGFAPLGVVLEEDFHLSFPFVFEDEGNIYMIPETSRAQSVRLYKATLFPFKWELVMSLIDGIKAVDTVVFKKDKKWFMLTNFCTAGIGDNSSELHLYSSDTLLTKDWISSKNNPVVFDSERARNGGLFNHGGKHFRVGQVQGKSHYGKSCVIYEIAEITEHTYEEVETQMLGPHSVPGVSSLHHFHRVGKYLVFDSQ